MSATREGILRHVIAKSEDVTEILTSENHLALKLKDGARPIAKKNKAVCIDDQRNLNEFITEDRQPTLAVRARLKLLLSERY